jgi:hypothetical protein
MKEKEEEEGIGGREDSISHQLLSSCFWMKWNTASISSSEAPWAMSG